MSYLNEAFKALSALNEDTFTMSDDGIKKLSEFEQNDDLSDEISVIDLEAETEDDLQDSYVGKVILDCSVCHSKLYKNKDEVTLDEEGTLANVGEECPYCYTSDGFKVIGEVSSFNNETVENEETIEDETTEDEVIEEGLFSKKKKTNNTRPSGSTSSGYAVIDYRKDLRQWAYASKKSFATEKDAEKFAKQYAKDYKVPMGGIKVLPISSAESEVGYAINESLEEGIFSRKKKNDSITTSPSTSGAFAVIDYRRDLRQWHYATKKSFFNKQEAEKFAKKYEKDYKVPTGLVKVLSVEDAENETGYSINENLSLNEDYTERYVIVARNDNDEVFYYDANNDNMTTDLDCATQYAEYDIANDDVSMIYGSISNDFSSISVEPIMELDLLDEATATLDKPMSKLDGTLGNVLTAHKDELSKVRGKEDGLAFLDSIEPEVKNKGYLRKIKEQIAKIPEYKVPMLLYNLILKGDGMGISEANWADSDVDGYDYGTSREWNYNSTRSKKESVNESVNNVNVETDDATVSVSQDDNGTVTVQTTPKDDGTTPINDETIVPVSDETQTEIENNISDEETETEEVDVPIEEFDEESFDELGESYLKRIYENVDSYHTTNITNYNDHIKVEGVIKFDTGSQKKTSFIFESKDCTKSGKLRFIGENVEITNGKKAFTITGSLNEKQFITESFNYNYKTTNEDGTSSRIYGTLRKERASK